MTSIQQWLAIHLDMQGKMARYDWHGVSDAANDLRVLEARMPDWHIVEARKML